MVPRNPTRWPLMTLHHPSTVLGCLACHPIYRFEFPSTSEAFYGPISNAVILYLLPWNWRDAIEATVTQVKRRAWPCTL
jgi:hypothetical protein